MPDAEVARQVKNTFQHEWVRAHRVKRTFTELGFNKGRLPMDLWTSMQTYYYNNAKNLAREEWNDKGVFVNWWDVESYMIGMPWKLKTYWQSRLKVSSIYRVESMFIERNECKGETACGSVCARCTGSETRAVRRFFYSPAALGPAH